MHLSHHHRVCGSYGTYLRPHFTMPKEQCRVAILLVGRMSSLNLSLHTLAMRRYIVEPLRADVFAVSDNSTSAADLDRDWKTSADATEDTWAHVLPRMLGRYLRTYATYGEPPEVLQQAAATSGGALRIESLRVPKHKLIRKRTWGMWLKLQDAWKLLEARELAVGQRYTAVVRLRSDATPLPTWSRSQLCAQTAADKQSIFSLTDQAFCGSRAAMAVAARLHSAIFTHYMGTWNGMTARPFSVPHAIATARAQHPCAFSGQTYRFYNKLVHLQVGLSYGCIWVSAEQTRNCRLSPSQPAINQPSHARWFVPEKSLIITGIHLTTHEAQHNMHINNTCIMQHAHAIHVCA